MPWVSSVEATRTVEFSGETLSDIVGEFEMFLKGCGFHFEGHLELVRDFDAN